MEPYNDTNVVATIIVIFIYVFVYIVISIPVSLSQSTWAAVTKFHRLGNLDHRNLFSHSSGSWGV